MGKLIAVLILVTVLGLSAAIVPFRPCGICDGFALSVAPIPGSSRVIRLNCPHCGDRGKVALFRSWKRPAVSQHVAILLRDLKNAVITGAYIPEAQVFARRLLESDGKRPEDFLQGPYSSMNIRFVGAAGKERLIVLQDFTFSVKDYPSAFMPGPSGTAILLFSLGGQLLDSVRLTCSFTEPVGRFVEEPSTDGAQMIIIPTRDEPIGKYENAVFYSLSQWMQVPLEGLLKPANTLKTEGICRLRILEDRLEILQLSKRKS